MSIYKPSLLDKFKDFVHGLKSNWDQYEDHVEDFETAKGIITDTFDETRTYAVGDYAIYENVLYKCVEAIEEAGEWDADKWAATNIAEEFKSHLAESASDNVHGLKPVELWSGNAGEPGQLIYLSDSIDKFEKIVLWVSFLGQEFRDWYHKLNDYIDLKSFNLSNDAASTRHQLYEMRITKTSNTILEITHNVMLTWNNDVSSITNQGDARLYGVLGVGKKE